MATQVFAPTGGMNQDDSIINPTPEAAGRNAFGLGDYKYALNARIGSSKSDNFGDLENLKGTTEVTNYLVSQQEFENPDFAGSLFNWSQISVIGTWTYDVGESAARIIVNTDQDSSVLYQGVPTGLRTAYLIYRATKDASGLVSAVFLNGTTAISKQVIVQAGKVLSSSVVGIATLQIPDNCNGIGIQYQQPTSDGSTIYVYLLNLIILVPGSPPSGTNKVVGKFENREQRKLYHCVYNSNGDHSIRYYDPSVNSIIELIRWDLNFGETSFVKMAMLDNWLSITDRRNNPRLIDVDNIIPLFFYLGSEFRDYHIDFHKWGPVMPPVIKAYWNGSDNNYAKFENKVLQFSYRYGYKGKLKSRWSPISSPAEQFEGNSGNQITAIEIGIPGFNLDVPGALVEYNYFNNDDIKFTSAVEYIEIGYRESKEDLWRILQRYDVQNSDNMVFRYSGNANSTPIPIDDFIQPFDTVPLLAGTVESIDNRFVFADCLDEYEPSVTPIITDVGVAKWSSSTDSLGTWWNAGSNNPSDNAVFYPGMASGDANELGLRNMICDTTFKGRGLYKLGIQFSAANGWKSGAYTSDNWIFEIAAETGIVDKLYALMFKLDPNYVPPEWAVSYQIVRTNCLNIDSFMFGAVNAFIPLIDNTSALSDNLEVPESIRNRIQQRLQDAKLVNGQDYSKYNDALFNSSFYQSLASDVRRTVETALIADASRIYIDINNWVNSSKKNASGTQNNPMNKLFYNWRPGDRIRFLASTTTNPSDGQKTVYDVPILECTSRGIVIEKPIGIQWVPGGAGSDATDYMIEVYTPKTPKAEDYFYFESGEWYPVLYPGTSKRDFSKRDWTYTNSAAITCSTYGDIKVFINRPFSYGDCHGVLKTYYYNIKTIPSGSVSVSLYTASMNPDKNKVFGIWEKNEGRPTFAYADLPVVIFKTTQLRFGGQIVEQSFVNNINRFREEDQKIFPSEYGRIRELVNTANAQVESVGSIFLAIGERETFSIYVNRTTLEDLSGNTQVALSNRILGSYNTLLGSHGTLNPESVSVDRGRVYFWDAIDGVWVRYGRDGLTEISFYKMRNWFRELSQLLINEYGDTVPVVISEFDPYNEELITFINHSSLPETFRDYATYKGAVFSEEDIRWKSVHSYAPEMFAKITNQLLSFVGGRLFIHEANETHSTFYGTKYDVYIEPVFNEVPKNMKSWQNLAVVATQGWSADRLLSEYRGAKTKQQSSIALSQFTLKEDGYYASIPNNINTPVVSSPKINGDKMRSKALRCLMKLDPSVVTLSLLHYVEAGVIDSPKNP
jgi:hypothetical protein